MRVPAPLLVRLWPGPSMMLLIVVVLVTLNVGLLCKTTIAAFVKPVGLIVRFPAPALANVMLPLMTRLLAR